MINFKFMSIRCLGNSKTYAIAGYSGERKQVQLGITTLNLDAKQNLASSQPLTVAFKAAIISIMPEIKPFLTTLAKSDAIGVKRLPIIFLGWNVISFIFRDQDIVTISQTLELFYFFFSQL